MGTKVPKLSWKLSNATDFGRRGRRWDHPHLAGHG
jgi:hypothetical protein